MRANEFIKKFGWDEAKTRLENANGLGVDMWLCGWGFHSKDLQEYVDAYELVQSYGGLKSCYEMLYMLHELTEDPYPIREAITLVEECQ